jgi:Zn-dependent M28 family amino/carboxypeptidase
MSRPIIFALVLLAQAAQPAVERVRVDADRLLQDVTTLSSEQYEGRLTGSAGNRRAQEFIAQRFRDLKLPPLRGAYEHTFSYTRGGVAGTGTNLVATIDGSAERDRFIVIGAHYDHLGLRDGKIYYGADDNASGVAALLAAAEHFSRHRPRLSMVFVAFDAEESGLQGAKAFVTTPPVDLKRVALMVNMDMVSRGDKNTLFVAGTAHYPQLKEPVAAIARGRSITVEFGHDRPLPGAPPNHDWTNASDHGPFHAAGIPFLYFGVEDHPDYHKPTDTADGIPRPFYVEATRFIIETLSALDAAPPSGSGR